MVKAKAHPGQLGFSFEEPIAVLAAAGGAGLEAQICTTVGEVLAGAQLEGESRAVIAAKMSDWLGEEIDVHTLNAMSSPARKGHKVHMSRFFALLVVTDRQDAIDPLLRKIGGALLVGEEVKTARIGHLRRIQREIGEELRALERTAPVIRDGGTSGKPRK